MDMDNTQTNEESRTESQTENQAEEQVSAETESCQTETAEQAENTETEENKEPSLEEKIEALEKENAELKDQLLRRAADFDNYRKRTIKEKQDAFDYGNAGLLSDLLDSLDNFDRTVEAAKDATDAKSIADGVKMINKNLVKMLEDKYNLSSFGEKGEEFDPELHEAIGMMPGKVKKEELGEVYLKGYKLKDKVIRHAKVMVVKPEA